MLLDKIIISIEYRVYSIEKKTVSSIEYIVKMVSQLASLPVTRLRK